MAGFVDDCFTLDRRWVLEFSKVYEKEVGIPFHINTRFDNLDEEIVANLKEAGCVLVLIGVESGNEFIRNEVMKREMSEDTIVRGAGLLKKYRIKFLTENITGTPGENFDKALDTVMLNIRIKPSFANCSFFNPYPKLEMTDYAIKNRYFNGDYSKLNINYYHTTAIACKSRRDLRKMLNMRCFFSLIVKHPILLGFFKKVIFNLPPNRYFRRMGDLIDGYYLKQLLPYDMGIFHTLKTAVQYIFIYRRESH